MKKNPSSRMINPNRLRATIFSADLTNEKVYPRFVKSVRFDNFRHIKDLTVPFPTPVTVVSGSNRSGKTTLLLSVACSHFDFKKRNYTNGLLERQTWSDVLKLTPHDSQKSDWTYHLEIKTGLKVETKRGQRKRLTKKWNGLGKKESQIKDVNVVYLDLDRALPARHYSSAFHKKALRAHANVVSKKDQAFIDDCLSYILEETYTLKKLADHRGRALLGFTALNNYSGYNAASGEDVLSRILIDCIEAPTNALILIDELELGLHPKVQRRLMDVILEISDRDQKQFIITTHSATVLSCVPENARVFIDLKNGEHTSVRPISINAVLTKMDAIAHPLVDVFCEDDWASKIIQKALQEIESRELPGISARLFNIIISGSAEDTYSNFRVRARIYDKVQIKSGHVCVLDGDMQLLTRKDGSPVYPMEPGLYFLPGNASPEKVLCDAYERSHKNPTLRYHINNSNPHCLFEKMIETSGFASKDEVFGECWKSLLSDPGLKQQFLELADALILECSRYSPDL